MKRALIISGIITLIILAASQSGRAYYPTVTPGGSHFMRVDGRDANNRPVEASVQFENSVFYNAYAMLTSPGLTRYQRSTDSSPLYFGANKAFIVSLVAVPYIYSEIKRFLNHIKNLLTGEKPFFRTNLLLLFLLTVLVFQSAFHSTDEPRFRVPVFLE